MGYDKEVVEAMLKVGVLRRVDFEDAGKLEALQPEIEALGHEVLGIEKDETHGLYETRFRARTRGQRELNVNFELVQSVEFRQLRTLLESVAKLAQPPLVVEQKGKGEPVELMSKEELLAHLMDSGKRGVTIQRYKGLGEMNADQLWETTMDPTRRRVLEVRIEDGAEADIMFSVLMGDAVEPRRQFIEENALEVQNLDV